MSTAGLVKKLEEIKNLVEFCLTELRDNEHTSGETGGTIEGQPDTNGRSSPDQLDFSKPVRPFMRSFVGRSGKEKFALLLAWMTKGRLDQQIPLAEVVKQWNSMSGLLGLKFNRNFTSEAKDHDWVESQQVGLYNLRPNWKRILTDEQSA
jgi:hypothetical protein